MKVIRQIKRLQEINSLIKNKNTGTPEEFASALYISKRQLYNILDELRLLGLSIEYDTDIKSYYYVQKCELDISLSIEIEKQEQNK